MPRSLLKHLISVAWILLFNSAVSVHVSQAYRKTEQTSERMSRILYASLIVLSFQMVFNLDRVAAVIAILANISGLDPSSETIAPHIYEHSNIMYTERGENCPRASSSK